MQKTAYTQAGQVIIVVIFAMIIALTIALALASRSVTNLKVSKQNEESQRALQAAEAGIQQALKQAPGSNDNSKTSYNINFPNGASFVTSVISVNNAVLNNGSLVTQDKGIDVWLSSYPGYSTPLQSPAQITIYWATSSQTLCTVGNGLNTMPALEVVLITGTVPSPILNRKVVYDSCAGRLTGASIPSSGAFTISGVQFSKSAQINLNGSQTALIMKAIPIYSSTKIAVMITQSGSPYMPQQGEQIQSTGTSGDTKRTITYFVQYPQIPVELMPYSILSQGFTSQ